jgi:hypothetical protein
MRGLTTSDANSILSYCKAHVRRMSDRLHTKVRDMFFGLAQGNNNFLTYTQLATGTLERRITIVSPSQVPKDFGQGLVQLDGSYVAAALMGIYCNPLVDAGEPILLKSMGQVFDVDNFSDPFLDIEKNQMATAGITIIERQGTDLVVRDDLTTDQTTDFSGGLKFQRASDFIAKYVQTNLVNVLTGKRFTKAIRGVAQTQFILLLQALQEGQNPFPIITENGLEDISVTQNSTNHQQLDFKATITLIGDVKWEFALLGFKV